MNRWKCGGGLIKLRNAVTEAIERLEKKGAAITLTHVPREQNKDADALSNIAMDQVTEDETQIFLEHGGTAQAMANVMATTTQQFKKIQKGSVHPATEQPVNTLTSVGGKIMRGLNKRPVMPNQKTTESVILELRKAIEQQKVKSLLQTQTTRGRSEHWAGGFQPREHYPTRWENRIKHYEKLVEQERQEALAIGVHPDAPPKKVPDNAKLRRGAGHVCRRHHKGKCAECIAFKGCKSVPLETCCKTHHRTNDGLPEIHSFCKEHRMTKCGQCTLNNETMAQCCKEHHDQAGRGAPSVIK